MISELHTNGFLLLKNKLSEEGIKKGRESFQKTSVNYTLMDDFINNYMISTFNENLNVDFVNVKYRASNNNNSTDAGSFHRDLHLYTNKHNQNNPVNIFTCLAYLDESYMELIPKSHLFSHMNYLKALELFNKSIQIHIEPGDLLIFHANTIHRGIFYKTKHNKNRRLIQCFDCIDKQSYNTLAPKILHIPCKPFCNEKEANLLIKLQRVKFMSNLMNFINYFNVARGYGYKLGMKSALNDDNDFLYISTESNQERLEPKGNSWEKGNVYIIKKDVFDIKPSDVNTFRLYSHYLNTIILMFVMLVIIIGLVYLIFKNKNKIKKGLNMRNNKTTKSRSRRSRNTKNNRK